MDVPSYANPIIFRSRKMAKTVKYSSVAGEIKKDYLKEHLEDVKKLIHDWIPELYAPPPLTPHKDVWGWKTVYGSPIEQDPDSNHMLRRHLRSRSLWRYHSEWENELEIAWRLINKVRQKSDAKQKELSNSAQMQYSSEYTSVALWKGFDVANGRQLEDWHKIPDDQHGISYGAYKIELSAVNQADRALIKQEHRELIDHLAKLNDMRQLIELWSTVSKLQEQMRGIASKILKTGNILYPCTFCRHLWK